MMIQRKTFCINICAIFLFLICQKAFCEELTDEQRAIANAIVGNKIKDAQAKITNFTEIQKYIDELSQREKKWHGWEPAMQIGMYIKECRDSYLPFPKEINEKVVDDIIWQYENAYGKNNDLKDHRGICAWVLGFIGNEKAFPIILKSIEGESGHYSWAAIEGISDERFIVSIEKYLNFNNQQDAIPAIKCLEKIGSKSIPTLQRFLKVNDIALKREAINALIKICDVNCIPLLEEAITWNDPYFTEKAKAGKLLIRCRTIDKIYSPPNWITEDDGRLYYLTNIALIDTDPNTRAEATEAILKLGGSAIWHLRLGLENNSHMMSGHPDGPIYFVAQRSSDILARIGEPAIPALIDGLCGEYTHPFNRRFAEKALQKITGETFGQDYDEWRSWYLEKYRPKVEL